MKNLAVLLTMVLSLISSPYAQEANSPQILRGGTFTYDSSGGGGNPFEGGDWGNARGGRAFAQYDYPEPVFVQEIFIKMAGTDVTSEGSVISVSVNEQGRWEPVYELRDKVINRGFSGGRMGPQVGPVTIDVGGRTVDGVRLDMRGNGWFAASDIRIMGFEAPRTSDPVPTVAQSSTNQPALERRVVASVPPPTAAAQPSVNQPALESRVVVPTPTATATRNVEPSTPGALVLQYEIEPGSFDGTVTTTDVLGLRLGQNPDQVAEIMAEAGYDYGGQSTSSLVPSKNYNGVEVVVEGPIEFPAMREYLKRDQDIADRVSVKFLSPLNGSAVHEVKRRIDFLRKETKPAGQAFTASVLSKYGRSSDYKEGTMTKSPRSGGGMSGYMSGVLGTTNYTMVQSLDLWWYFSGGRQIPDAKGAQDTFHVQVIGDPPTLDSVSMSLGSPEAAAKDTRERISIATDVEAKARNVPRTSGLLPRL